MKLEKPLLHPPGEIHADGAHVPDDLSGRFLEGKIQAALTSQAGGVGKGSRQTCFACARCTGDEDGAAPVEPLPIKHCIQLGDARGDALRGNGVVEPQGSDWQDREAFLVYQEGILVGAVR